MKRLVACLMVFAVLIGPLHAQTDHEAKPPRFAVVDIVLDTHGTPLAAYQLSFEATAGDVRIVGIEGSEHPAFGEPPYYDPKAIQQQRVILASFNTADADELPSGPTRVATIHLLIAGETQPEYKLELTVAADAQGEKIENAGAKIQEPYP